jgi:hypothetical protein
MDMSIDKMISDNDANELYTICKNITIPLLRFKKYNNGKTDSRMGRARQFGDHRSALLGYVYPRFKPRSDGPKLSAFSIKHPQLYECLIKISKKYFPEHKWTSIQLNHNVVCTPHTDKHNNGKSIIFSVGDYIGCNLMIETTEGIEEIDIRNKITSFEGARYKHWNTPLISGEKYSFVFYL